MTTILKAKIKNDEFETLYIFQRITQIDTKEGDYSTNLYIRSSLDGGIKRGEYDKNIDIYDYENILDEYEILGEYNSLFEMFSN